MRMTQEERDRKYRNLHRYDLNWQEQFVRDLLHDADVADAELRKLDYELKWRREWMDKVIQLQVDAILLGRPAPIKISKPELTGDDKNDESLHRSIED